MKRGGNQFDSTFEQNPYQNDFTVQQDDNHSDEDHQILNATKSSNEDGDHDPTDFVEEVEEYD